VSDFSQRPDGGTGGNTRRIRPRNTRRRGNPPELDIRTNADMAQFAKFDQYQGPVPLGGPGTTGAFGQMGMPRARPGDVDNFIRTNYPYMAAFLGNPEVGPLLRRAAIEGWDEARLYGAVQGTGWWRSTSAAQREWQRLQGEDPAEAGRLAAETAAAIANQVASLGLQFSPEQVQEMALQATANGWTDAQVIDQMLVNVNWANVAAGDLTGTVDQVKAVAGQYLVGVSDETARQYAVAIASGEMSLQGVQSAMQAHAKTRWGWMADMIDQGVAPADYFAPVRDTIARELELTPDAVNLMDSKWLSLVETSGEDGKPRAATLNEARLAARKDPLYAQTSSAQELATQAARAIGEVFGRSGIR
jgi:hypothetical protein